MHSPQGMIPYLSGGEKWEMGTGVRVEGPKPLGQILNADKEMTP